MKKRLLAIAAISVLTIGFGIFTLARVISSARDGIYDEHDGHLSDLVQFVDHNVNRVLDRCTMELEYSISESTVAEGERLFLEAGDASALRTELQNSIAVKTELVSSVTVWRGDEMIACTDDGTYSFLDTVDDDNIRLCVGADGANYMAVQAAAPSGLVYYALIELDEFYEECILDSVYQTYWIVLYDESSGLILQNEDAEPRFKKLTRDEIIERDDGYTVLLECQERGGADTCDYTYINAASGSTTLCRMAVLSSNASENETFAIAVALDDAHIQEPDRTMMIKTALASAVAVIGFAIPVLLLFYTRKRGQEMEKRVEYLEKENSLSAQLLEQQKELTHHQRMETIGVLSAGIAHEFNNLLTPIMGYSMMLLDKLPDDEETFDNALEIYNASVKAKKLVSSVNKLSGKNASDQLCDCSANELVSSVLNMARPVQPKNVSVETVLESGGVIHGNEQQLGHMLLNLIINAFQAMEADGGVLKIKTADEGKNVVITVSDTGHGMAEDVIGRIFEPFFTTKQSGKGTGLGLAIAMQAAQAHGGTITVESGESGTSFFVVLPKK